jgi:hypothetical protein
MTSLQVQPSVAAVSAVFERRTTTIIAALASLVLALAVAIPAHASPLAQEGPPGSNGTVKIHEWPDHKNSSDMANDPKVCQFEIHGFGFDAGQAGMWWIQDHKWGNGDKSKAVLTGDYTADAGGDWTRGPYSLDDGHYKLFVEMTHQAGNSGNTVVTYKHKVFKVECSPVAAAPTSNPAVTPAQTPATPAQNPATPAQNPATPTQLGVQQRPAGQPSAQRVAGQQQGQPAAIKQPVVVASALVTVGLVSGTVFGFMSGTSEDAFFTVDGSGSLRGVAGTISSLPATSTAHR